MNPLLKAVIAVSTCPVCAAQHSPPPTTDQLGRALPAPETVICTACSERRYAEAAALLRAPRPAPGLVQRELFPAPPEAEGPQGKGGSPGRLASSGLPHTGPDAGSVRADTPQPGGAGEETPGESP